RTGSAARRRADGQPRRAISRRDHGHLSGAESIRPDDRARDARSGDVPPRPARRPSAERRAGPMSTTRLLTHSLKVMSRYRLRSAFVMLGSLVGVAALTLVVSIGQGMEAKVMKTVGQIMGDSSILIMSGGSRMLGSPRAGASRLTIDDLTAVAAAVDGI